MKFCRICRELLKSISKDWRGHQKANNQRLLLREMLADYAHVLYLFEGMRWMFNNAGIDRQIPRELYKRWWRQMNIDYKDLPEKEKESNRKEADRILAIVEEGGKKEA